GSSGLDALHLACAEKLKCDYFITCDDRKPLGGQVLIYKFFLRCKRWWYGKILFFTGMKGIQGIRKALGVRS
ncbi:MAG: hypothetical protein Q7U97_04800, partial [Rhodocyclaceae bacterium]|nr:hypothetical protein [Rhodocyclaceae bacterium]